LGKPLVQVAEQGVAEPHLHRALPLAQVVQQVVANHVVVCRNTGLSCALRVRTEQHHAARVNHVETDDGRVLIHGPAEQGGQCGLRAQFQPCAHGTLGGQGYPLG
jgi:hypothetical protein